MKETAVTAVSFLVSKYLYSCGRQSTLPSSLYFPGLFKYLSIYEGSQPYNLLLSDFLLKPNSKLPFYFCIIVLKWGHGSLDTKLKSGGFVK